ncbi:MAG: MFS transporter [Pseudomonadota bacterium]
MALPPPTTWATALLGCVTLIPILIGPVITGVLVDSGGLSDSQAGMTSGFGAVGSVSIALTCALFMHRLPLRRLAAGGLLLAIACNTAAAFSYTDLKLFYAFRALNALGEGAAYAAVMSSFARKEHSEQAYGLFMMLQFGIAGVALWAIPTWLPDLSVGRLYLSFATLQLLALPLVRNLPSSTADGAGIRIRGSEWKLLLTVPALAGLAALCFSEASNVGTDVYLERIAYHGGLSDGEIGASLGIASMLGVPGAFAIVLVGSRFGHALPVLVGFAVGAVSLLGILQANGYVSFLLFTSIHSVTWAFVTPYIQSLLADLDPGGAVVTAGGIASGAGAGLGPAAAASLVSANNYGGVLTMGLLTYAVAAVAILITAHGLRKAAAAY